MLIRRINRPTRVRRTSTALMGETSYFGTSALMLLNFHNTKGLPSLPILWCLNNTGPEESILIKMAISRNTGSSAVKRNNDPMNIAKTASLNVTNIFHCNQEFLRHRMTGLADAPIGHAGWQNRSATRDRDQVVQVPTTAEAQLPGYLRPFRLHSIRSEVADRSVGVCCESYSRKKDKHKFAVP